MEICSKNITNGFGRKNKISLTCINWIKTLKVIIEKPKCIFLLSMKKISSQEYSKLKLKPQKSRTVTNGRFYGYKNLIKAKNAEVYSLMKRILQNSPDVYVSDYFKTEHQVSKINPQQNPMIGETELVSWTTPKGYSSKVFFTNLKILT